jgi:hypothetical protein
MASITFDIFAKDHASKVFKDVGKSSGGLKGKMGTIELPAGTFRVKPSISVELFEQMQSMAEMDPLRGISTAKRWLDECIDDRDRDRYTSARLSMEDVTTGCQKIVRHITTSVVRVAV